MWSSPDNLFASRFWVMGFSTLGQLSNSNPVLLLLTSSLLYPSFSFSSPSSDLKILRYRIWVFRICPAASVYTALWFLFHLPSWATYSTFARFSPCAGIRQTAPSDDTQNTHKCRALLPSEFAHVLSLHYSTKLDTVCQPCFNLCRERFCSRTSLLGNSSAASRCVNYGLYADGVWDLSASAWLWKMELC